MYNLNENVVFHSSDTNDWKMTRIILELGGDVTFETSWDKDFWRGYNGKKGNGLDFAKDLKINKKSSNNYDDLILMLNKQKVVTKLDSIITQNHISTPALSTDNLLLLTQNIRGFSKQQFF